MRRTLTILLFVTIGSGARADRIDLPPEQLEAQAPYIVVGEVVGLDVLDATVPDADFSPSHRRGNLDRHFRYTVRINEVEKSRGDLDPGQVITVEAWRMLDRPGGIFATVGYQGHRPLPARGDEVRIYMKGGRRTFQPLDPNGFAALAGNQLGPPLPPGNSVSPRRPHEPAAGRVHALLPGLAGFVIGVLTASFTRQLRNRRPRGESLPEYSRP